jgi:hypothetical protein
VELLVSKSIFDVVLWMLVIWLPSILRIACSFEIIVPRLITKYTGHGLVCSALYFLWDCQRSHHRIWASLEVLSGQSFHHGRMLLQLVGWNTYQPCPDLQLLRHGRSANVMADIPAYRCQGNAASLANINLVGGVLVKSGLAVYGVCLGFHLTCVESGQLICLLRRHS